MKQAAGKISKPALGAMALGAICVAVLYFGLPNYNYFVDGLIAAVEMRDTAEWIVHPHHPLHPLLPQITFKLIGGESGWLSELEVLQVWAIAAGVLACWGLMMLFRAGGMSTVTVLSGLGLFAFSGGVWYFSVTPNQYSTALALNVFTLLAIALTIKRLPGSHSWGSIVAIGILTSLAILSIQINAVLLLPAIYTLAQGDVPRRRKFLNILGYLVIVIISTLGLSILVGIAFAGFRTPADFIGWQHSYVFQARWWAHGLSEIVQRNCDGIINTHLASVFIKDGLLGNWAEGFGTSGWFMRLPLRIAQALVLLFFAIEIIRALVEWVRYDQRTLYRTIGLLTALPIILFTCFWVPESSNYRILYLPGLLVFLMPVVGRHFRLDHFKFRRAWPVMLVIASMLLVNLTAKFIPESNPENNRYRYEINRLAASVGKGDLIIYSGAAHGLMRGFYARYFLNCDTIMIHELISGFRANQQAVLADLRARHQAGGIFIIHEDALSSEEDRRVMKEQYNVEILPDEVVDFLDVWTVPISMCTINGKNYFRFEPKESS